MSVADTLCNCILMSVADNNKEQRVDIVQQVELALCARWRESCNDSLSFPFPTLQESHNVNKLFT